jgi:amidase
MTRSVRDAAFLLSAIAADRDYASHATEGGLIGKRIGVPRRPYWGYSAPVDASAERALGLLSAAGATVVDDCDLDSLADWEGQEELDVLLTELNVSLTAYLRTRTGVGPQSLAELVDFNRDNSDLELAYFGQGFFERALEMPGVNSLEYAAARTECLRRARDEGTERVLREYELDALVAPSFTPAIPIDMVNKEHYDGSCSTASAIAGHPIITVPSGQIHGLPVAISFWGAAHSEPTLIEIAHGYEAARVRAEGEIPLPTYPAFV